MTSGVPSSPRALRAAVAGCVHKGRERWATSKTVSACDREVPLCQACGYGRSYPGKLAAKILSCSLTWIFGVSISTPRLVRLFR